MAKQMCWLCSSDNDEKILYMRENESSSWLPYTAFPQYKQPDHRIQNGSKGWATYQKLMKSGWILVNSSRAYESKTQLSWNVIDT